MTSATKIGAAHVCGSAKMVVTVQSRGKEMIVREFAGSKTFTVMPSSLKLVEDLVNGVGIVGDEVTHDNGVMLSSFSAWKDMINRVYTKKGEQRSDKRVCDSWLRYRNFKWWYDKQRAALNISDSMAGSVELHTGRTYQQRNCKLVAFLSEPPPKKRIYIMKPDGGMTTTTDLKQFCKRHNLQLNMMYKVLKGTLHQHKGYKRWS